LDEWAAESIALFSQRHSKGLPNEEEAFDGPDNPCRSEKEEAVHILYSYFLNLSLTLIKMETTLYGSRYK